MVWRRSFLMEEEVEQHSVVAAFRWGEQWIIPFALTAVILAAVFSLAIFFLLPAPFLMRQILAVAVFASAPSACVVYSNRLGVDASVASAVNPITTLLSLPIMALILTLLS